MGHLYRFVEPVLLLLLKEKGRAYGYELVSEVPALAMTDAEIEAAALYRTLRQLEKNGCVTSEWNTEHSGPARRVYALTPRGEEHLAEWVEVLEHMSKSMARLVMSARVELGKNDGRSRIQRRLAGAASGPA
jgi:poly-beta-hydroxybutyrate-responsive repressor